MDSRDREARRLELLSQQMSRLEKRLADRLQSSEAVVRLLILGIAAISLVLSQSAGDDFRALRAFMPCVGLLGLAIQAVLLYHSAGFCRSGRELRNVEQAMAEIVPEHSLTIEVNHWTSTSARRGLKFSRMLSRRGRRPLFLIGFSLAQILLLFGVQIALQNGVSVVDVEAPVIYNSLDIISLARDDGLSAYAAAVMVTAVILCVASLIAFADLLREVALTGPAVKG